MSDYTDLIEALRAEGRDWREQVGEMPMFDRAADAIEALVKERDEAIRDLDAGFAESDHLSAKYYQRMRAAEKAAGVLASESTDFERERDELAAEVERLKLIHVGQARLAMLAVYLADVDGDEGTQAFYQEWVRAHDAALIESLADHLDRHFQDIPSWTDAYRKGVRTDEWMSAAIRMTMSVVGWLRERARQVREGEA